MEYVHLHNNDRGVWGGGGGRGSDDSALERRGEKAAERSDSVR